MSDPRFERTRSAAAAGSPAGERLQKVLATAGLGSRRDCELAIRAGRVRVNGRRVNSLPCLVRPGQDLIELDGSVVKTAPESIARGRYVYLMLHKPRGVISTARDPQGRPNVVGMVEAAIPQGSRVYPVGRLDADSTGLMLLTNDGELAWRLTHPSRGVPKEYLVTLLGNLTPAAAEQLRRGAWLAGPGPGAGAKRARLESLRVLRQRKDRSEGDQAQVAVTLTEGQNREIRRLFARVGLKVRRLERRAIGPLQLGRLPAGRCRHLTEAEVAKLRHAAGLGPGLRAPASP